MAVSFVNGSANAEHATANSVFTAPTGIVNGDLLIIWQFLFNLSPTALPTPTPPTGFAALPGTWPLVYTDDISNHWAQYAWFKIASSESGNYTVTHTAVTAARGSIVCITGNDTTTPFSPSPTQNSVADTATTTFTGLTTLVNGALILLLASDDNDNGTTLTAPTGTTPTFTAEVNDAGGNFAAAGVLATAGATGNKTMTNNSATGNAQDFGFFASMVAVQPAASDTNATVTAVPLAATGDLITPTVSTTADATVNAAVLAATGDLVTPTVSSATDATVSAPTLAGTGALVAPVVTGTVFSLIVAPPLAGSGALVAPTVSTTSNATVAAAVLAATGDLVTPDVSVGQNVTIIATPLAASGDLITPTVSATRFATVTTVPLTATGRLPIPTVSNGSHPAHDVDRPINLAVQNIIRGLSTQSTTRSLAAQNITRSLAAQNITRSLAARGIARDLTTKTGSALSTQSIARGLGTDG